MNLSSDRPFLLTASTRTLALTTLAGLALASPFATGVALAGGAGCNINQFGMPDFDQRRQGLANNGSNHCVPTSNANVLGYFATHGAPGAFPGVDKTYGQEDYNQITANINLLGAFMNTSGTGGTTGTNGYNGLVAWTQLFAPGQFSVYRLGGAQVNPVNFFMYRVVYGGYLSPCYGRYTFVGGNTGWNRNGGHCVTLFQLENWCANNPTFHYRDPAADEGNVANRLTRQSSSGNTSFTLSKDTARYEGTNKSLWRMNTGASDGVKRALDGLYIIVPHVSIQATGSVVNFVFSFPSNSFTPPPSVPTGGTVLNHSLLSDLASLAVIHPNRLGTPSAVTQVFPGDNSRRTLGDVSTTHLAIGRRGQVYVVDTGNLVAIDSNPLPPLPPVELARFNLGTTPEAIGVDPRTDEVVAFIPAGAAGPRVQRFTKNLVPLGGGFYPSVPGNGALKIKPGPQPGHWYLARVGDGSIKRIIPPAAVGGSFTAGPIIDLPGTDTLQDFNFHEAGMVYNRPIVGTPSFQLRAMKPDANGRWAADPTNPFDGRPSVGIISFSSNADNYDIALDGPDDEIGPNPEDFPSVPDCVADIASAGVITDPDGELTSDDIILFIRWFTTRDERADVASSGPVAGPDGEFTADDIIFFINSFFQGC